MSKAAYPRDALHAARYWADLAYRHGDISSALDGYRVALEILPRIAWLGLSTTSRQNWLFDTYSEGLSCLAATCAIQQGHVEESCGASRFGSIDVLATKRQSCELTWRN